MRWSFSSFCNWLHLITKVNDCTSARGSLCSGRVIKFSIVEFHEMKSSILRIILKSYALIIFSTIVGEISTEIASEIREIARNATKTNSDRLVSLVCLYPKLILFFLISNFQFCEFSYFHLHWRNFLLSASDLNDHHIAIIINLKNFHHIVRKLFMST